MAAYIVRRVLLMITLLFVLSVAVFVLFNMLPGDPARLTCGKSCTPVIIEQNRHRLGYDLPPHEQYIKFISGIFFGRVFSPESPKPIVCEAPCLGYSFNRHEEVLSLITRSAPVTFWLAIGAFILWISVGVSLGIFAALRRGRWPDRLVMGVSLIGYSLPSFFFGLLLIFFVIIKWQLLPFPSYVSPFEDPVAFLQTMILPWIVLAILYAAFYMRLTRNQVLEVFNDDFVRTARAKGLTENKVVVKHVMKNALIPVVTLIGPIFAAVGTGSFFVEQVFNIPGMGKFFVTSMQVKDQTMILAVVLIYGVFLAAMNLLVDLVYGVIDPRIRY